MTRYRISRPTANTGTPHGTAREIPALELVVSEDSSEDSFPGELVPTDECLRAARLYLSSRKYTTLDVHSCKSNSCDVCRKPMPPTFIAAPAVSASMMQCLPLRWWEKSYDDHNVNSLVSAAMALYNELLSAVTEREEDEAPYDELRYG